MVVSWIWYSIWKFWVIYVLVFLVFQVFSTAELISLAKTVNLAVWAFSLIFLHDFTLFGIDMHNIYHISSISTTFGPLWNMGFPGPDPNLHLALCPMIIIPDMSSLTPWCWRIHQSFHPMDPEQGHSRGWCFCILVDKHCRDPEIESVICPTGQPGHATYRKGDI